MGLFSPCFLWEVKVMKRSPAKPQKQELKPLPLGLSKVKLRKTVVAWGFMLPAMIILILQP